MILYLEGNILQAARIVDLTATQFCASSTEEMASIEFSEESVKALYTARFDFVIELERNDLPPVFVEMKPHPYNTILGIAWFVPSYFKMPKTKYDVEYTTKGVPIKGKADRGYASGLTEKKLDELVPKVGRILRVYCATGMSKKFLDKFNLRLIEKGKFHYAVPKKS